MFEASPTKTISPSVNIMVVLIDALRNYSTVTTGISIICIFVLLNICTCVYGCVLYACVSMYMYVYRRSLAKYRNIEELLKC